MKTREQVNLELLDDNPWQPRKEIEPDALQELADSIRELGLLQAPLGRWVENERIQLAFGHRRVAACRLLNEQGAGGPTIDMDLADISDEDMAVLALTENERRRQLTQIEVVRAHKRAIDETSLSVQGLAGKLGMNRSTLANNLRVLELPDFVLEHVESGALGLTVAREFLVLQNSGHAHTEEMRRVVKQIANTWGSQGAPDWSRRHVRQLIHDGVAYNETDFRPLGPRQAYFKAGGAREATFDVEAFSAERPETLHTIPDEGGTGDKYESSRVWTCDVKEWRTLQTRATREFNKEAEAAGGSRATTQQGKSPSREQQFQEVLATDPVWNAISVSREKPGPAHPVNDEEREQLGTRAEFREVESYGGSFWKILQKARPQDIHSWDRENGGHVPPWFPNLKECQKCTIGAAYAKTRGGYGILDRPTLVCFNRDHYREKLQAGEAAYRSKLEAHRTGIDRQDTKAVREIMRQLEPLPETAFHALATSLLAATPTLKWLHPLGVYHQNFSYESQATVKVRELLGGEVDVEVTAPWQRAIAPGTDVSLEDLSKVAPGDLRELVAALITHHLRRVDKVATVSRETPSPTPENEGNLSVEAA